jgi:hypothetical protein
MSEEDCAAGGHDGGLPEESGACEVSPEKENGDACVVATDGGAHIG